MMLSRTVTLGLAAWFLLSEKIHAQYPDYYGLTGSSYISSLANYNRSLADSYYIVQQAEAQRIRNATDQLKYQKEKLEFLEYEYKQKAHFEVTKLQVNRATKEEKYSDSLATESEILGATALNVQLDYFKRNKALLSSSQSVKFPQKCLERGKINVANISGTGGALAILQHEKLPWPTLFQDPLFQKQRQIVDEQFILIKQQAISTGVNLANYDKMKEAISQLREIKRNHAGRWIGYELCLRANSFLTELSAMLNDVQQRRQELALYLNPIQGSTVAEVVAYMLENGIVFAPATTDQKEAYRALYDAFAEQMNRLK